jgi:hypothetical protein
MAASKSPLEHFRGERGLENLRAVQQVPNRPVRICEIDVARGETEGLLEFARLHDTRIISQSSELLAEAARHGIPTIDLNGLADLLKPEVVQGDELVVKLVKPGKERDQAVGYLEDGNMVVVENGREDLGRTVRIMVMGIHQTRAGTLIFGTRRDPVGARADRASSPDLAGRPEAGPGGPGVPAQSVGSASARAGSTTATGGPGSRGDLAGEGEGGAETPGASAAREAPAPGLTPARPGPQDEPADPSPAPRTPEGAGPGPGTPRS